MKTINKYCLLLLVAAAFSLSACSKFLDTVPDNRTELDNEDKIVGMLVSAYPQTPYLFCWELSSDNVDFTALANPEYDPIEDQIAQWEDVTDTDNEDPSNVWSACYSAIASSNKVLEAISELEKPLSDKMLAAMGEAYVTRAYSHFILVNMFCQSYNPEYADEDLGIPYMTSVEVDLKPHYDRGTVADVYEKIEADLNEGLELINDVIYSVPKYHFNQKAAYAFAARFYLFYQKWDEAIAMANVVLGSDPKSQTRDMAYMGSLDLQSVDGTRLLHTQEYFNPIRSCNLLLHTGVSNLGVMFGPYNNMTGYNHGNWLNSTETFMAKPAPWGSSYVYYDGPYSMNTGKADKAFAWRLPYLFEYSDPVNNIGWPHTVFPAFTIEETLLVRAEANIMKKAYSAALADMNIWVDVYVKSGKSALTETSVNSWANSLAFYTPDVPTPKKRIEDPAFPVMPGTQENMCYALLHMRRLETLHLGLRWLDVKRYGITISRRKLADTKVLGTVTAVLRPRDNRCAIQIPAEVITAGLTPNPR